MTYVLFPFQKLSPYSLLNVTDSDGGGCGRDRGQNLVALLNVDGRCARTVGTDSAGGGSRLGVGERNGAEIGEGDERVAFLVVLYDPLGVRLAERSRGGERLGDRLALGHVLDDGAAGLGAGSRDGESDNVACAERDAREVVGVVRIPLVPACAM